MADLHVSLPELNPKMEEDDPITKLLQFKAPVADASKISVPDLSNNILPAAPAPVILPATPAPVILPAAPAPVILPAAPAPVILPAAPAPVILPAAPAPVIIINPCIHIPKIQEMALKIFNSLSHKEEQFQPNNKDSVGLYTCGPTVYNYPHIGNYRAYIFSDMLKSTSG
jgi:hypothetical protein